MGSCTGSLVLAAAGVLDGVDATTHWAVRDELARLGAVPLNERVVQRGKVVTAAGVSAGIDMALTLAGQIAGHDAARAIQLMIEYDPAPPYDCGAPEKASPEVMALLEGVASQMEGEPVR
ncbi:MAG: DJ-1/PfpI family protein [Thermoleophilaceae bacterium]